MDDMKTFTKNKYELETLVLLITIRIYNQDIGLVWFDWVYGISTIEGYLNILNIYMICKHIFRWHS